MSARQGVKQRWAEHDKARRELRALGEHLQASIQYRRLHIALARPGFRYVVLQEPRYAEIVFASLWIAVGTTQTPARA